VGQPAEDLAVSRSRGCRIDARGCGDVAAVRWPQVPGPVRAMLVMVRDVLVRDRSEV
jgi:hypothetical protein